jgi:hypothetical protein
MPGDSDSTPHVYRAINADGQPVEVTCSREIVVVCSEYVEPSLLRERFGVDEEAGGGE